MGTLRWRMKIALVLLCVALLCQGRKKRNFFLIKTADTSTNDALTNQTFGDYERPSPGGEQSCYISCTSYNDCPNAGCNSCRRYDTNNERYCDSSETNCPRKCVPQPPVEDSCLKVCHSDADCNTLGNDCRKCREYGQRNHLGHEKRCQQRPETCTFRLCNTSADCRVGTNNDVREQCTTCFPLSAFSDRKICKKTVYVN